MINTFKGSIVGIVAPKSLSGNKKSKVNEAAIAPKNCAIIYFGTSFQLNFFATAKPRVTAGSVSYTHLTLPTSDLV